MATFNPQWPPSFETPNFETIARQYWGAWGEAMRNSVPGAAPPPQAQPWHEAIDWWSKLAHGGRTDANDAVSRFNQQARQWFGQMQQVAAQYAGQDAGAADITRSWKQALGAAGENPFPEMFRSMRGQGQQGLDQWLEDASPYLEAMRGEGASWLKVPTFGLGREAQERLQKLAQAQMDYQHQDSAYNALMMKSAQAAYEIFEQKLGERSAPGRQVESARALFDLWIDAAEEAYGQIALSPEFREVYGKLVNAQMRLRAGIQGEVEQVGKMLGMPSRSDVDGAYRKIAELERSVRKLRDAVEASGARPSRPAAAAPAPASVAAARPVAADRSAVKKATRSKPKAKARPQPTVARAKAVVKAKVAKKSRAATKSKAPAKSGAPAKSRTPAKSRAAARTKAASKPKPKPRKAMRKVIPGKTIATPVAPRPLASKAGKRR